MKPGIEWFFCDCKSNNQNKCKITFTWRSYVDCLLECLGCSFRGNVRSYLFVYLYVFLLILNQGIKDKNQNRRIALLRSVNNNCVALYLIIPLLHHFTILGHRNAQNKPSRYQTAPSKVQ